MTDCAAPRHQDEPQEAAPGARLCGGCERGLRTDLRNLPQLYAQLAGILIPSGSSPGDGDGDGLPYNDAASDCMSQISHDLAWWARELAGHARTPLPADPRVPALAGWLHGHVQWISVRPCAPQMAGAFASDRSWARALLNPSPVTAFPVPPGSLNHCPDCDADGQLRAIVHAEPGDPRTRLACSGCGAEWGALEWMGLGRRIIRSTEAA